MKKKIFSLLAVFMTLSSLSFSEISAGEAKKILQKAEENTCFYDTDMKGDYQIVHDKPGEGRNLINAVLYRRDSPQSKRAVFK